MRSVCWRSLAMSIWSSRQWLTISSAASCGISPEPALHAGQRGLDVEVFLGAVLVGPDVAHRVAAEDALEDAESMMVEAMMVVSWVMKWRLA